MSRIGVTVFGACVGVAAMVSLAGTTVSAHPTFDEEARAARIAVEKLFTGSTINDWQPAPMPGMYMFTVNKDERVYFVDQSGRYLMAQAAVFDLVAKKNWTQGFIFAKRQEVLAGVPLEDAILYMPEQVAEGMDPAKPVLVFDDPDCPFCREFHREVKELVAVGVPVAVFLHPVEKLHKGATEKSMHIWCADDRQERMDSALAGNVVSVVERCDAPIERNLQLAKRLGGGPTPYIVLPNGRGLAGKKSATELLAQLGLSATLAQHVRQVER